jgi:hypothetical protein
VTTDQSTSERVLGAARALFQERKSLSVDDIRAYLKEVAHIHLPETEVEEIVGRLFIGQVGNLPAVELHQAFVFKRAARGFWLGQYSILVLQCAYTLPDQTEESGTGRSLYLLFGIAGDEEAAERLLGAASDTRHVQAQLQEVGIDIGGWFPLATSQWQALLPHTKDLKEIVEKFGKSLFSPTGSARTAFVGAC